MIELLPADIVLVSGKAGLSGIIKTLTRGRGEPKTRVSHAGIIHDGGAIRDATLIEALASGVKERNLLGAYGWSGQGVSIWRRLDLSATDRKAIQRAARMFLNRPYGYVSLLSYALFRRLIPSKVYPVCSQVVSYSYYQGAGRDFGVKSKFATPDDIDDWLLMHPECAVPLHALTDLRG